MKTNSNHRFLFSLLAFLLFLFSYSCTEKIVNQRADNPEIKMSLKLSSEEMASSIDHYRVTISAPDIDPPIVIDTGLSQKDGYPFGTINVPAGRNRILTVEAIAFQEITINDMILYRGVDTVDIMPDSTLNLTIDLYPVPPCLKFSPRFVRTMLDSTISLDLKAFNIKDLNSIVLNIPIYDDFLPYFQVDSAVKGSSLGNGISFSTQTIGNSFVISINQSNLQTPIVDENGNATLAKVFLKAAADDTIPNIIHIPIVPSSINGDTVPSSSIFIDGCTVEIPGVLINFPIEGQAFPDRVTHVEGMVGNGLSLDGTLSLNGQIQPIAIKNGLFNQDIVLFFGPNEIIVTAPGLTHPIADTVHVNCTRTASALRVQLNWNTYGPDADLWVTEPGLIKVYYDHKISRNGGVLDVDNKDGFGPENYSIDSPPAGTYHVQVSYNGDTGPGPLVATVKIFENETLKETFQDTLRKLKDSVSVCRISMPDGQILPH